MTVPCANYAAISASPPGWPKVILRAFAILDSSVMMGGLPGYIAAAQDGALQRAGVFFTAAAEESPDSVHLRSEIRSLVEAALDVGHAQRG
eukprot:5063718-Pyramimonas_sp.AAC.1